MKRILLFVLTNLAVVLVLGVVASLLGVNRYLTANGLNLGALLGFALVMGFGGAIISLLISKPMAKWTSGVRVIDGSGSPDERWIVETVRKFADKAGIDMPEVGIFEGDPNAFATGAFKNSALVAVSTGLLENMTHEEIEAVLGHEIAHIANGDMVTMALIQGVMNTFVVFLSRVIGFMVDSFLRRNDERKAQQRAQVQAVGREVAVNAQQAGHHPQHDNDGQVGHHKQKDPLHGMVSPWGKQQRVFAGSDGGRGPRFKHRHPG